MANTSFNTRIKLKLDTYKNWNAANPVLLAGEAAVCVIPAATGAVQQEPVTLIKIGDGTKHFNELEFIGAKAADVYDWAKAATKPSYAASEISGLSDYIAGEIQDTDTQYQLVKVNDYSYKLQSKDKGGAWADVAGSTITIPQDTLVTGSANGTVAFNGTDVAVKGLGSAAYTEANAYDLSGAAQAVQDTLLGTDADDSGANTIFGANKAAAAAAAAAANAQTAADTAQDGVNALAAKVGTVTEGKTVVQMIEEAQTAATYDDTEVKASIKTNADAISVLNGAGEGSVSKSINDAFNDFATKVSDDNVVNTYKELVDYAASHSSEFTELVGEVTTNKNAIATLNGDEATVGSVKKTVADAISDSEAALQTAIDGKVDKETGKGLSSNDYTNEEKTKLEGIAEGAQVNVIETVKVNGVAQTVTGKAVDISVPTGALASKDEVAEGDLATELATKINGKVDATDCGDIIGHNVSEFAASDHNHDAVYSKLDHTHDINDLTQGDYIIFDCGTASTVI